MGVSSTQLVVEDDKGRVVKATRAVIVREFPQKGAKKKSGGDSSISLPGSPASEKPGELETPPGSSLPSVASRGRGRPKGSKNKIKVPGPAAVPREPRESNPAIGLAHKKRHVVEMQSNKGGGDPEDYGIILADPDDPNVEPENSPTGDCGCGGDCCDSKPSIITQAAVDKVQPENYSIPWRRF